MMTSFTPNFSQYGMILVSEMNMCGSEWDIFILFLLHILLTQVFFAWS